MRWGFACKVLNGTSPATMYERLEEGLEQIKRSPADTGFVFFNFKNILDHCRAWPLMNEEAYRQGNEEPMFGSWPSHDPVARQLAEFMETRWMDCIEFNGAGNVAKLFNGHKSMPGAAVYMATATAFRTSVGPMASIFGQFGLMRYSEIPVEGEAVLARINDVARGRA